MNEAELDLVAGGTISELHELVNAMTKNSGTANFFGKTLSHIPVGNEFLKQKIAEALFQKLHIDSDISVGFCGTGLMSKPNKYWDSSNGGYKPMTHAQVMERIKNYKG